MHLRDEAIRVARARELSGFILTSNGSRADLDRLADLAGGRVLITKLSKAQACARIASIVPSGSRRARVRGRHREALVRAIQEGRYRYRGRGMKRELRASVKLLEERGTVGE